MKTNAGRCKLTSPVLHKVHKALALFSEDEEKLQRRPASNGLVSSISTPGTELVALVLSSYP